jgi:DNA-binding transcriptional ArsR family regulator
VAEEKDMQIDQGNKTGMENTGWKSGPSIAIELDVALAALRDYTAGMRMPAEFASVLREVPESWREEAPPVMSSVNGYGSLLEVLAWLSGTLFEGDYGHATLPMRDLTLESALARLEEIFRPLELESKADLPIDQRFIEFGMRGKLALYQSCGLEISTNATIIQSTRSEFERTLPILKGGEQHDAFWHWIDRFYFQLYHDWRSTRASQMESERQQLAAALGAMEGAGRLPSLDWLPPQNALNLNLFPWLKTAVETGRICVFFWIEPFGMADLWGLYPGLVFVAFAPPGALYENFAAEAADVAARANALSDPTRLIILRMIRHFGMVNTDIAAYLGISRPTVSIHAKILREAGLIRSEQVGREMRHTVVPSEVHRLFRDLERFLNIPEENNPE